MNCMSGSIIFPARRPCRLRSWWHHDHHPNQPSAKRRMPQAYFSNIPRLVSTINRLQIAAFPPLADPSRIAMAAAAQPVSSLLGCPSSHQKQLSLFQPSLKISSVHKTHFPLCKTPPRKQALNITCSATDKPSSSSEISSAAKIRSEVLSPFRSVRMFFYLAFIASGALGGLIATTQLIAALANSSKAADIPEITKNVGIDVGAVSVFVFLYLRENKAKSAQVARLSREESLSNLKLRVDQNKIISVSAFRGIARLVILAGPSSFIVESFKFSKPFTQSLLDRGVLVVPFTTDGEVPTLEFEESEDVEKRKKLWQLRPVYASDWTKWLDEQKEMANVPLDAPVYISLRLDGRVRGSGVGYPPWNAFVAQLPPVKGLWTGLLDGFDGRV